MIRGQASTVARVIEVLPRASTSPAIVETGDGARRVMKFSGAGPGPFGLLTELLAIGIARALGAPVPAAEPILLPEGLPWLVGTDEFDAMLQRSSGWNLGIDFVPDARAGTVADLALAPASSLDAIARADALLVNVDRTAKNPNLLVASGHLWAIDYDACLYLSRALAGRAASPALPQGHLLAGREPPEPLPPLDLAALVAPAPEDWIATTGTDRPGLVRALERYIAS